MDKNSKTTQEAKIEELKKILPEAFAEGKIDWVKLQATLGESVDASRERYGLNWAGKSDAFKVLQTPSTGTLVPVAEEGIDFENSDNIFIEGENLEVLKILQRSYFGKIKMIYIDPPYNTGSDSFIYPDKFGESLKVYQARVGDKDDEGNLTRDGSFRKNSKENGHYHSNWLNMMMPRLYLAKNLLRHDGVIFVSIDDNEVHNLRLLMNEIFGEENFVAEFTREAIKGGSKSKFVRETHDFILVYARDIDNLEFVGFEKDELELNLTDERGPYAKGRELNKWGAGSRREDSPSMWFPIMGPNGEAVFPIRNDGTEGRWRLGKEKMKKIVDDKDVIFEKRKDGTFIVYEKLRGNKSQYTQFITILKDKYLNARGSEELKNIFQQERAIFDFSKPTILIKDLLILANLSETDIILDFFAGSGTTAHAVMELNAEDAKSLAGQGNSGGGGTHGRKFICVQMPEPCDETSEAFKAGYKTIADICKERIRRASKKISDTLAGQINFSEHKIDLGFKVFKLAQSNFKQWRGDASDAHTLGEELLDFTNPLNPNAKTMSMVYEFMLKNGIDLCAPIQKQNGYFVINNGELILLLETIDQAILDAVIALQIPMVTKKKVIALDVLFHGNDQLKTNTVLQMKDANIEFSTL